MKLHLTVDENKELDGGCRFVSLPRSGYQKLRMQDLVTRFAPCSTVDLEKKVITFNSVDGPVEFKIENLPNPDSKTGGHFLCSVVKTKLTKRLMEAKTNV